MNKKYLLLLLAIIIAIIVATSLNNEDSEEDKVFKFSDFTITCPPGSSYENNSGVFEFYTKGANSPNLTVYYSALSGLEFNQFIRGSELLSDEQILSIFNSEKKIELDRNYKLTDYNITEFKNYTVIDIYLSNGNNNAILHVLKVSDSKIFLIKEYSLDSTTSKIYNSINFR